MRHSCPATSAAVIICPVRVARLLVAAIAAVVCAAFVIGIRQVQYSNAVTALLAPGTRLTPTQQRAAASDLRSAAFAYPGEDVPILKVQVALNEDHFARALSIARAITAAEPDNIQGWVWFAGAADFARDLPAQHHARQEEIRLDPLGVQR